MRASVTLLSALILKQGVPFRQPSAEPDPLPEISAFPIQRGVPPLQPIARYVSPPPPLSVLLQGIGVPSILPSAMRAYDPLLW